MGFKTGRQTERAGIDPTLSAVVAERGIASPKAVNQYMGNVCEDNAYYGGNTLFDCLVYQVILSLFLRPLDGRT